MTESTNEEIARDVRLSHDCNEFDADKRLEFAIVAALRAKDEAAAPLDMLLFCPQCGEQHVDEPQPEKNWDNPPHKSHACQFCGCIWRPSDKPTNGVLVIASRGGADTHTARPRYYATAQNFNEAAATALAEARGKAFDEAIEIVDSFFVLHEEISEPHDLVINAEVRAILNVLTAAKDDKK